jgi:hypothetical protein
MDLVPLDEKHLLFISHRSMTENLSLLVLLTGADMNCSD